ncbi:sodium/glucose cotransporter 4-like [Lytechinus variegatus]|uniref:sodium/glucose cotransporter 4-like n=1 Tax=Lytechinus variegatus TaxID=7654 RepID=UPI001BB0FB61|nr:sodium/glucose cotransporter 4-like [Lytechinus variegatus]
MEVDGAALKTADIVVIVIHFIVVLALGIWSAWKANRGTTTGYFLAGKSMSWWLVGLSLYVSNIGSIHFIGLSGTAANNGIAVISYEFSGLFCLLLLGYIFMPIYIACGVITVPEYLQLRFGGSRLRICLSVVSIVFTIVTTLASEMYAGIVIIQQVLGWNLYLSLILLLAMTVAYTMAGGLTAVIYTDALQSFIMIIGGFILFFIAMVEIGGFGGLYQAYMHAIPNSTLEEMALNPHNASSCGIPTENAWHIFRAADAGDYPWPGVIGIFLLSAQYFCTNQFLVQRSMSTKNFTQTKAGTVFASYLKVLPLLLMIYPGMVSRALWPDEVACIDPDSCIEVCGNPNGCTDIAYPRLVLRLMPTGLKGLMFGAMLAALMSTLTSVFNSLSTLFTMDIWTKIRPVAKETELLIVGRACTGVMAIIAILWLPLIQASGTGQLFVYIQAMASYLTPPIFAVFVGGMFWERVTEKGAFFGLLAGVVVGVIRMILDYTFTAPGCGQTDNRPSIVSNFHYLYFATVLFTITLIVIVIISLFTEPIRSEKLVRLTWWTRHSKLPRQPMDDSYKPVDTPASRDQLDLEDVKVNDPSCARRACGILCGITLGKAADQPSEEEIKRMTSLEETPFWYRVMLANLIIAIGFGIFLFGFFG